MVAASLIPQHFKVEHQHKLAGLSDEELQQKLIEAEEELAKAGLTIDLKAKEVVALPSPKQAFVGAAGLPTGAARPPRW